MKNKNRKEKIQSRRNINRNIIIYYLAILLTVIVLFGVGKINKYDEATKNIIGNEPVKSSIDNFKNINLKTIPQSEIRMENESDINLNIKTVPSEKILKLGD